MAGLRDEVAADRDWLAARVDEFVSVSCPACGSAGQPAFRKLGFEYQRCAVCRTAFMSPRPTEADEGSSGGGGDFGGGGASGDW